MLFSTTPLGSTFQDVLNSRREGLSGVRIVGIIEDQSPLKRVYELEAKQREAGSIQKSLDIKIKSLQKQSDEAVKLKKEAEGKADKAEKRAHELEQDIGQVKAIINEGCEVARDAARETLAEVRQAMGLKYD